MARWTLAGVLAVSAAVAGALGCGALGGKKEGNTDNSCESGWHACGPTGECAPDTSPTACGVGCTVCRVPSRGVATCVAGACAIACDVGYHACGATCADDASPAACGPGCVTCPVPVYTHALPACVAGACAYACEAGWVACAGGCCEAPVAGTARISGGDQHTCAITDAGVAKCWGSNAQLQDGDGTTVVRRLTPVTVSGSTPGSALQIGVGMAHSCGVASGGGAWCWGEDGFAQLGDGGGPDQAVPVEVSGLSGVLQVGGGWAHSCALLSSGGVKCWGNGERGVLGDGHAYGGAVAKPVPAAGLSGAFALLTGFQFNCALTGLASMACWGDNARGQLGNGASGTVELAPVEATALTGVTLLRAAAAGTEHTCVAYDGPSVTGGVRCWGRGDSGQLGNGTKPATQAAPVEVTGLSDVVALAAGAFHTCALTGAGAVLCWGRNFDGQLGTGTGTESLTPAAVSGLGSGAVAIGTGLRHTCALVGAAPPLGLKCWGWNQEGQLGDGTQTSRAVPVAVLGF